MTHTDTKTETVEIRANRRVVKHLGTRMTGRRFDVRASHGHVVLDLLLAKIEPGEIEVALDIDHAAVKLLVPAGTTIDDDDLRRLGRGGIKDRTGAAAPEGRRIKLVGELRDSEVRVHRGGVAILSLLSSRSNRLDVRHAHREGRL